MSSFIKKTNNIYTVHETKTHFSKLLALIEAGEEVTVAKGSQQVAKIVPIVTKKNRVLGTEKDKLLLSPDFDEPITYKQFLGTK